MKKVTTAFLAVALFLPAMAFAQSTQQEDKNTKAGQNQAAETAQNGSSTMPQKTMSGMVSNSGMTFTSGDKAYQVNNPKSLKAYNDQMVSVVFQFNTDNNTIHVNSVKPAQ